MDARPRLALARERPEVTYLTMRHWTDRARRFRACSRRARLRLDPDAAEAARTSSAGCGRRRGGLIPLRAGVVRRRSSAATSSASRGPGRRSRDCGRCYVWWPARPVSTPNSQRLRAMRLDRWSPAAGATPEPARSLDRTHAHLFTRKTLTETVEAAGPLADLELATRRPCRSSARRETVEKRAPRTRSRGCGRIPSSPRGYGQFGPGDLAATPR